MKAWQAARVEARSNLNSTLQSAYSDHDESMLMAWIRMRAERYVFDGQARQCFFCYVGHGKMTTGVLPGVGAIWKCGGCKKQYKSAKGG